MKQWLFLLFALWGVDVVCAQSTKDTNFLSILGELREATYSDKANIVERLSASGHPNVRAVLTAFLEDRLYFRNGDQKVFIAKSSEGDPVNLIDPLSLKDAGSAPADNLTRIGTNNSLRRALRTTLAQYGLSSADSAVRLAAVQDMLRSLDESNLTLLRERFKVEPSSRVKKEISTALALAALDGSDTNTGWTPSLR